MLMSSWVTRGVGGNNSIISPGSIGAATPYVVHDQARQVSCEYEVEESQKVVATLYGVRLHDI
jgi:hypothetical protein